MRDPEINQTEANLSFIDPAQQDTRSFDTLSRLLVEERQSTSDDRASKRSPTQTILEIIIRRSIAAKT
jgi:hypothetical protein